MAANPAAFAFDQMDKDGNGFITREGFQRAMLSHGVTRSSQKLSAPLHTLVQGVNQESLAPRMVVPLSQVTLVDQPTYAAETLPPTFGGEASRVRSMPPASPAMTRSLPVPKRQLSPGLGRVPSLRDVSAVSPAVLEERLEEVCRSMLDQVQGQVGQMEDTLLEKASDMLQKFMLQIDERFGQQATELTELQAVRHDVASLAREVGSLQGLYLELAGSNANGQDSRLVGEDVVAEISVLRRESEVTRREQQHAKHHLERMYDDLRTRVAGLTEALEMLRSSDGVEDSKKLQEEVRLLILDTADKGEQMQKLRVCFRDQEVTIAQALQNLKSWKAAEEEALTEVNKEQVILQKRLDDALEDLVSRMQELQELKSDRDELDNLGKVVNQRFVALDQGLQELRDVMGKAQEEAYSLAQAMEAETSTRITHIGEVQAKVATDLAGYRQIIQGIELTRQERESALELALSESESRSKKDNEDIRELVQQHQSALKIALFDIESRSQKEDEYIRELVEQHRGALELALSDSESRSKKESEDIREIVQQYEVKCTEQVSELRSMILGEREARIAAEALTEEELQRVEVQGEGKLKEERLARIAAHSELRDAVCQERQQRTLDLTEQRLQILEAMKLVHHSVDDSDDEKFPPVSEADGANHGILSRIFTFHGNSPHNSPKRAQSQPAAVRAS